MCFSHCGRSVLIVLTIYVASISSRQPDCDGTGCCPDEILKKQIETARVKSSIMSKEEENPSPVIIEDEKTEEELEYVPVNCGRRRKHRLDPNAPKKALSSFFWFCQEHRSAVREANPDFHVGEVARELGRMWLQASEAEKQKFEAIAGKDRARYEQELAVYEKRPKPAEDESDEEEEKGKELEGNANLEDVTLDKCVRPTL